MTKILAINSGSSSLKFQLFEMPEEKVITKGLVERIGIENSVFTIEFNGEKNNFFYEIENFKQNFLVLGEKYSYNVKNKAFQFSYILFDENNNEINKIEIAIRHV